MPRSPLPFPRLPVRFWCLRYRITRSSRFLFCDFDVAFTFGRLHTPLIYGFCVLPAYTCGYIRYTWRSLFTQIHLPFDLRFAIRWFTILPRSCVRYAGLRVHRFVHVTSSFSHRTFILPVRCLTARYHTPHTRDITHCPIYGLPTYRFPRWSPTLLIPHTLLFVTAHLIAIHLLRSLLIWCRFVVTLRSVILLPFTLPRSLLRSSLRSRLRCCC